jgi:hypothetical protein
MVYSRSLLILLIAVAMTSASEGQTPTPPVVASHRAVPDDNLAYPVKVDIKGSQGSGFYLNSGDAVYFVTAKHVLFDLRNSQKLFANDLTLESFSKDVSQPLSNIITVDLGAVSAAGLLKSHASADVVVIKIAGVVPSPNGAGQIMQPVAGVILRQNAPDGIVGVDANATVKKFDEVQISNDVYVFGYPNSIGLQQIAQIDQTRPLIRKGIVSGLNRALRTIILDCEVYPGNSGGLVLEVENEVFQRRYKVIGLVSQYVPFDNARFGIAANPTVLNSGYSVVTPIDFVLDLIAGK